MVPGRARCRGGARAKRRESVRPARRGRRPVGPDGRRLQAVRATTPRYTQRRRRRCAGLWSRCPRARVSDGSRRGGRLRARAGPLSAPGRSRALQSRSRPGRSRTCRAAPSHASRRRGRDRLGGRHTARRRPPAARVGSPSRSAEVAELVLDPLEHALDRVERVGEPLRHRRAPRPPSARARPVPAGARRVPCSSSSRVESSTPPIARRTSSSDSSTSADTSSRISSTLLSRSARASSRRASASVRADSTASEISSSPPQPAAPTSARPARAATTRRLMPTR